MFTSNAASATTEVSAEKETLVIGEESATIEASATTKDPAESEPSVHDGDDSGTSETSPTNIASTESVIHTETEAEVTTQTSTADPFVSNMKDENIEKPNLESWIPVGAEDGEAIPLVGSEDTAPTLGVGLGLVPDQDSTPESPEAGVGLATTPLSDTSSSSVSTLDSSTGSTDTVSEDSSTIEPSSDELLNSDSAWLKDNFNLTNASYKDICGRRPWLDSGFR